jgi:hypothetical protein
MVTRSAGWKPVSIVADAANNSTAWGVLPDKRIGVAEIRLDDVLAQVDPPLPADLQAPRQAEDGLGELPSAEVDVSQAFEAKRFREWVVGQFG